MNRDVIKDKRKLRPRKSSVDPFFKAASILVIALRMVETESISSEVIYDLAIFNGFLAFINEFFSVCPFHSNSLRRTVCSVQ